MTKKRTIHSALPIVAAAYGEKFGVKVAIGNDTAYTDGKTIVVPNIPDDYPHKDALWGYLAHEAAHVRFTDFGVQRRRGLHAELSNILEDCRIERAMQDLYPGTRHTLNEVARYMAQAGHYSHVTDEAPPASILTGYCLYWLQTKAVGQSVLQDYLDSARSVLERKFPKGVVVRLNALLRKAVGAKSTAEAVYLADEIIKMIEEEKEKEEQQPQGTESQADQQPQDRDDCQSQLKAGGGDQDQDDHANDQQEQSQSEAGNGSGTPSQMDKGSQSQASDGQSPSDQSGTALSEQPSDGQSGEAQHQAPNQGGGGPVGGDAAQLLQQVLDAGEDELLGDAHESLKRELNQVAQQQGDDRYLTVRSAVEMPNSQAVAERLLGDVKSTTAKIRTQLYGLVQASQREAARTRRSGKRVDMRRLHRLVNGDTRVFLRREDKVRPNTAVHILVDMSSSMSKRAGNGKERQDIAREAALAISLALEAIPGVNPAVTFFCGSPDRPVFSAVKHGERAHARAGKFGLRATGGTPMAEAIWHAAFELTKTREERKMIVVVTDGEPSNHLACHAVLDLCEASGIETIGIGIESAAVKGFFDNNIVIDDATDLRRTLFRLMERSLTAAA